MIDPSVTERLRIRVLKWCDLAQENGQLQKSDLAPASRNVPDHLLHYGVAAAAVFAAGAFVL